MKRVAGYVRVSTEEQKKHGISVDSQIEAIEQYCRDNGYTLIGIYNDAGISARKSYKKRPALLRLMEDCRAGIVDLVVFTKLDRYFRSVADYYEVQRVLDEKHVPWRAIWEDYETETSAGVFKVNIMLSVAQSEADRTSERIKAVNEYRRAQGKYIGGQAPTGYKKQNGGLVKDSDCADIVAEMFRMYEKGYNTIDCVKMAHDKGLNVARETFTRMLKNTAYYGNASGYKCEPYITYEQYQKNYASVVGKRQRSTAPEMVYLFSGIIKCAECGRGMSGSSRKFSTVKKGDIRYRFYRCIGFRNAFCENNRTITEMKIERYLLDNLESELAKYNYSVELASKKDNAKEKISQLEAKLARIGDRYEDGDISKDEYKSKRSAILVEINKLNQIAPSATKELPHDWQAVYASLDPSHKRAFWRSIISCIEVPHDTDKPINIIF